MILDSDEHTPSTPELVIDVCRNSDEINDFYERENTAITHCRNLLNEFVKRESPMQLTRSPQSHFVTVQHCLVANTMAERLLTKRLTFLDIREDLDNLACLGEFMKKRDTAAEFLSTKFFLDMLSMTGAICNSLEETEGHQATNWNAIYDLYKPRLSSSPPVVPVDVPSLQLFQNPVLLGAGGFGSIYKVEVNEIEFVAKLVALPVHQRRIMIADKLIGSLVNSLFVARSYCCFRSDSAYVSILEFVRGVDLQQIMKSGSYVFGDEINQTILAQIALALQFLHCRGFIHRDIKPSNVVVKPGCRIKLIDFDTCKVCSGLFSSGLTSSYLRRTFVEFRDGESAGTLYFLAPEVLSKFSYGRAIDWWSLGVISYQMCTGRLPFRGSSDSAVKRRIKRARAEYGPNAGDALHQKFTQNLLVRIQTDRLTSANFDELKKHEWFTSTNFDWDRITANPQEPLCEFQMVYDLMDFDEKRQQLTVRPNSAKLAKMEKADRFLLFGQMNDASKGNEETLFSFNSNYFQKVMRSSPGETIESETPEFITESGSYIYKFQDYLV